MISDEVFKDALEVAYKAQGIKVKERKEMIKNMLQINTKRRDSLIDYEENLARTHQATKKSSKKVRSEFEEQCEFVHWFKKTYPGVVIMSIRNGGSRTPRERADQIREGLHPGAADLFIPAWRLWIEFKKVKGGIVSKEQEKFADYVRNTCNDYYFLAEGCEQGKLKILAFAGNILK